MQCGSDFGWCEHRGTNRSQSKTRHDSEEISGYHCTQIYNYIPVPQEVPIPGKVREKKICWKNEQKNGIVTTIRIF